MKPNDAARGLLASLGLPKGAVSILPWQKAGKVVMHVMVSREYLHVVKAPSVFEGYKVLVEPRENANALKH
ncbi:Hypothetical protein HEAR3044 [Herminiimonas arsenicoxydans]|uniref:Uncharacterized protein n=1 Tax=Herminiimonas arsenicoxydans TaxID=204773 RepID=A4G9G6_HERAR|nr:Hypothetical protein HEAR3044 [Herminiimonas arsenicoxydans]